MWCKKLVPLLVELSKIKLAEENMIFNATGILMLILGWINDLQ